jgi:hypothetical protein
VTLGVGLFPPRGSLPSCSSAVVVVVVVPDLNVMAPRGQLPPFQPCVFYSIILSAQVKSFWTCLFIPWRSFKRVKSLLFSPEKKLEKGGSFFFFFLFYFIYIFLSRDVKRLNKRKWKGGLLLLFSRTQNERISDGRRIKDREEKRRRI